MTCAEVRESLSEFSLGLLPGDDRREVERHLEWCAGCRRESAELAEGVASVALSLPVAEPPAPLDDKAGQFTVNLVSSTGRVLEVGTLVSTGNGDHVLFRQDLPSDLSRSDAVELSQVASLEVLDRFGTPVLTGSVHRFIGNASSS